MAEKKEVKKKTVEQEAEEMGESAFSTLFKKVHDAAKEGYFGTRRKVVEETKDKRK